MKTKSAVVYQHNQPVVVETLDLDEPKAGEVMIRMVASGVCHSDWSIVDGTIYYDPPVVLGHEGAGIVERIGEGVTYVEPGDHVVLSYVTYCGECTMCEMGKVNLCRGITAGPGRLLDDTCRFHNSKGQALPQMARIGTMSEYTVVAEQALVKVDEKYPLEKAVLVGCGVTTGVGSVLKTAEVEPGSSVAIIGCGGVGLNAVQGAAIAEASMIIAVDMVQGKLDHAVSFGATHTVDASEGDPVEAVLELTDGLGVDYAIEVIGNPNTIMQGYRMVRPAGTVAVVGMARSDATANVPAQDIVRTEKRLVGSYYGSAVPREDMVQLLEYYDEGKIKLDELITKTYTIEQVNEAFDALNSGENVRGVILF
ncbi:MAG: Zn-dependent alcohol dehydrogenase [Chloroflexota bacterium]